MTCGGVGYLTGLLSRYANHARTHDVDVDVLVLFVAKNTRFWRKIVFNAIVFLLVPGIRV